MHGCVYFLPVIGFQLLPRLKAIHSQEISQPDVGMADAYPRLATRRTHSCLLHGRFWAGMAIPNPIPLGFTLGNSRPLLPVSPLGYSPRLGFGRCSEKVRWKLPQPVVLHEGVGRRRAIMKGTGSAPVRSARVGSVPGKKTTLDSSSIYRHKRLSSGLLIRRSLARNRDGEAIDG
jgi:hypothetical protein